MRGSTAARVYTRHPFTVDNSPATVELIHSGDHPSMRRSEWCLHAGLCGSEFEPRVELFREKERERERERGRKSECTLIIVFNLGVYTRSHSVVVS